jgi:phosphotriesterase-related protein
MAEKRIMTVCGPIAPEALGVTSMCDHIFHDGAGWYGRAAASAGAPTEEAPPGRTTEEAPPAVSAPANPLFPVRFEDKVCLENVGVLHRNTFLARDALRQDDEAVMARELSLFRQAGGGAVLDAGVAGNRLGGALALRRISEPTGVHVVAAAGFCLGDAWPEAPRLSDLDGCYRRLLEETERGLGDADVRPGCLKLVLDGLSGSGEQALKAAARVSLETGLLLILRFFRGALTETAETEFPEALRILKAEGADMARVLFNGVSCVDRPGFREVIRDPSLYRVNTDRARRILDAGCAIGQNFPNTEGMELWGDYDAGDWAQMSGLVSLIGEGYCDQIVLGNDCRSKIMLHGFGGEGFCRMLYYTLPMLRGAAGVSDYALRRMSEDNPARLLAY